MAVQVGAMRERISILEAVQAADGSVIWEAVSKVWAAVEQGGKNIPFASSAAAGDELVITLRTYPLSCGNWMLWRGRMIKPVKINTMARPGYMTIRAALVLPVNCEGTREEVDFTFPGALAEKWVKFDQGLPMDTNVITYVLVTPKLVTLPRGSYVSIAGIAYHVQVVHELDPDYNEFELVRTVDL